MYALQNFTNGLLFFLYRKVYESDSGPEVYEVLVIYACHDRVSPSRRPFIDANCCDAISPQAAKVSKTISPRRMLTGLTRVHIFRRLGFFGTLCGLVVSALMFCGSTREVFAADAERVGLPWDWSHEHLLFSKTDDPEVLAIIQKDPRAFHQWLRRNGTAAHSAMDGVPISFDTFMQSNDALLGSATPESGFEPRPGSKRVKHKRDWGVSLGATNFNPVNAPTSMPLYPAKYTFDISATPSCQNDYAVFPTGANGKTSTNVMPPTGQASIIAYNYLYSTQGSVGGYCKNNGPKVDWAYINAACPATSSNDPILSSPVISVDGTKGAWVTSTGKVRSRLGTVLIHLRRAC